MEAAGYLLVVAVGLTGAALGGRWAGRAAGAALAALLVGRVHATGTAGDAPTLLHVPLNALVPVLAAVARPLPGADVAQGVAQELAAGCAAVVAAHRWPARLVPPRALRAASYGTYRVPRPAGADRAGRAVGGRPRRRRAARRVGVRRGVVAPRGGAHPGAARRPRPAPAA